MKLQLDQQADFSADSVDSSATSDMETDNGYYHAPEPIHTSSTVAPVKKAVHIPPFIIPAVVIILLALALTLIPWHKKSSLDSIYRSSAQDIQTSLGVTLSENPGNLLEIVPSYMLIQKSYYARCPEIVGMAKGKDEAIDMAVDIVKNIYGETGAFQVKEYFKNR